ERQNRCTCDEVKILFGDGRKDAAFHAHHRAHERVDDDEQRELRGVLAQSQTNRGRCVAAHRDAHACACASPCPRLNARTWSISVGLGGTWESASTKASSSSDSMGFQRFSNASVLVGFPLKPAPHTDPEK